MPTPTNTELYEKIKQKVYSDNPTHSLFRSAQVVKQYKEAGGGYTGSKTKDGINNWFKANWISINDLYHSGKPVPCGSTDTESKYGEYPLCKPQAIADKLSRDAMKKLIDRKDKLKHNVLNTESVLGTDKYNVKAKYT
jgi:hypothetical protein